MIGTSSHAQAWGCVGLIRPNSVKNCPIFNWRPQGRDRVVMNASSNSTCVSPSTGSVKSTEMHLAVEVRIGRALHRQLHAAHGESSFTRVVSAAFEVLQLLFVGGGGAGGEQAV